MADGTLQYQNPSVVDELLDTEVLTVGLNSVHRERVVVAGATDVALAAVMNAAPTTEYGLVVRVAGSVTANAGTNLNTSALNLEATQTSVLTSLQIMDDWDESDRAKVNLIVGQAGVAANTGAIGADTQRVVFGTTASSLSDGAPNPNIQALAAFMESFDGSGWNRVSPTKPAAVRQFGPFYTLASSDNTPISTATDTTLIAAPGNGMKLRIAYIQASNSSATVTDVMWRDGASGTRRYRTTLGQNSAFAHNIKPGAWDLTNNTALVMTTSAAGSVHWTVEYETVSTTQ